MPPRPSNPERTPDALLFKIADGMIVFKTVMHPQIEYMRWLGWTLLISERDIRQADIEDVRRSDEER